MTDMAKTPEEMEEMQEGVEYAPPAYPYGLCISLTHEELDKLGLDDNCEVGDILHMVCMAKATSVNKNENGCRIEMQIFDIEVLEDESAEFVRPVIKPSKFYNA